MNGPFSNNESSRAFLCIIYLFLKENPDANENFKIITYFTYFFIKFPLNLFLSNKGSDPQNQFVKFIPRTLVPNSTFVLNYQITFIF